MTTSLVEAIVNGKAGKGLSANGLYTESIPPASAEASGSRSGVATADRLESGRWHVANQGGLAVAVMLSMSVPRAAYDLPCGCRYPPAR